MNLEQIQTLYRDSEVCMGELLAAIPADNQTIEQAFELYIAAMKWSDGDEFTRCADGEITIL